jgi:hypothetical protein
VDEREGALLRVKAHNTQLSRGRLVISPANASKFPIVRLQKRRFGGAPMGD